MIAPRLAHALLIAALAALGPSAAWAFGGGAGGSGGGGGGGGDSRGFSFSTACPHSNVWIPGQPSGDSAAFNLPDFYKSIDPDIDDSDRLDHDVRITRQIEVQWLISLHREWMQQPDQVDETKRAVFCNAYLEGVDMSDRDLQGADFRGAWLAGVDFSDTDLTGANLRYARGLAALEWNHPPKGIGRVRESFVRGGLRENERELTYSIRVNRAARMPVMERLFNTVFFDWTSGYGLEPGRPLLLMGIVFLTLIPFYSAAIVKRGPDGSGIYRFWPPGTDRIDGYGVEKPPSRLEIAGIAAIGWAAYFSLLSAFHIGWRDFNVGSWLGRVQTREFTLRALGWPRFLSGLQSLLSVYLIALAALTYFGRPFQ